MPARIFRSSPCAAAAAALSAASTTSASPASPAVDGRPRTRGRRASPSRRRQQGSVVLYFAASLIPLMMFGAFAIDLARLSVVRNELQNAADAAALSGANSLYSATSTFSTYDWTNGENNALLALKQNAADGTLLTSADIKTGFWNSTSNQFNSQPFTPGTNDSPAVKVTVTKGPGQNGGPVDLFFGSLLGTGSAPTSATAVAMMASPDSINPGGLVVPLVVSECIYKGSWNVSNNPSTPVLDPKTGQPKIWSFGPGMSGGSTCGDESLFTSFSQNTNNVADLQKLFATGNPGPLRLGDLIWVQAQNDAVNGVLVPMINACSKNGNKGCEYVTVAVVPKTQGTNQQKITSFACLHILSGNSGGTGYSLTVQLGTLCRSNSSGGISPPGTVYRTRLVQ
jgi:Flp pilus assembly protein TadG